jgi:hypothetical protein
VIHLLHGIRTSGPSHIEGLIPYLAPDAIAYPDYGWILGAESRIINPCVVGTLKPYVAAGDIFICHSNGCAIAYDLMHSLTGLKLGGAIFINGALEQNIVRPGSCPWIDVYFNKGDLITEAAKIGAELGLDDPVWGELGHAGYEGADSAITNINCGSTSGLSVVSGHSDFFNHLADWGPFLVNRLRTQWAPTGSV